MAGTFWAAAAGPKAGKDEKAFEGEGVTREREREREEFLSQPPRNRPGEGRGGGGIHRGGENSAL